MDLDKETYELIIKTATNVERILERLDRIDKHSELELQRVQRTDERSETRSMDAVARSDREFDAIFARFGKLDERMDKFEKTLSVLVGKFSVIWMLIGSAITAVANLIFWLRRGG
jgi:tetrahydromethanopterin S-methyltransferase subunit G